MAILTFTLSPEAVGKLHDALVCLGKFSEAVSIDANRENLILTALNSTKSTYASFTFSGHGYFTKYLYYPPRTNGIPKEKFTCKIYNKALLSVFKGRAVDPLREKDTDIERCEVTVEDGAGEIKSRFIVKMICRHGVLKSYRLTFESSVPVHVLFDREKSRNRWAISSRNLREFVEHFGPGTEQLDIYSEEGRVNFTSYTEKIASDNEVLKQPLHTSIAIDAMEFSEFSVEEKLHIVISVKDFKAIVTHAGMTATTVSAAYSHPSRPFLLKYSDGGVTSEFVLMTIGDFRGSSTTPAPSAARNAPKISATRQPLQSTESRPGSTAAASMPPPSRHATLSAVRGIPRVAERVRPPPPPPQPSIEADSLFVTDMDDDRQWGPPDFGDDDEPEMVGWDASADNDAPGISLNSTLQTQQAQTESMRSRRQKSEDPEQIAPTQRISQIRGIFGD